MSQCSGRRQGGVRTQGASAVVSRPTVAVLHLLPGLGRAGLGGAPGLGARAAVGQRAAALLVDKESVHPEVEQFGTRGDVLRPTQSKL